MVAKRVVATASMLILAMAVLAANAGNCRAQAQSAPNLSGTWELVEYNGIKKKKENEAKFPKLILAISQEGSQIRITQKRTKNGTETVQEYSYYTDGRGEKNIGRPEVWGPDPREFESVSDWQKDNLVTKYDTQVQIGSAYSGSIHSGYNPVNTASRRRDEWQLRSNGKILVLTSRYLDINTSAIAAGRIPDDPRLNSSGAEGDRAASYASFGKSKLVFRKI